MALYEELKGKQVYIPEGVKKIYEAVIKEDRSIVINDLSLNSDLVPNGSLFIDARTSKMKVKKHGLVEAILADDIFEPESVTDSIIQRNTVNGNRIRPRTISRDRILQETLTGDEIENSSIPGSKLKSNTIEKRHLKTNSVDTEQICNNAITSDKIKQLSIQDEHIKENAIHEQHIAQGQIKEKHLEAEAVTSSKIKPKSVLSTHIDDDSIQHNHIGDAQILENHLATDSVSHSKIQPNSISTEKIQNLAVDANKLAKNAVTQEKIMDGSVDYKKLAEEVEKRILNSLDVSSGVGTLPILNALQKVITKNIAVAEETATNTLKVANNASVEGRLHVKGDISTDGVVYRAGFNDLAEGYVPGEKLEPGDVVQIEEDGKIYKSEWLSTKVVGVISDCYADCYGASFQEIQEGAKLPVGMIGRVPVKIIDEAKIGQYITPCNNGIAITSDKRTEFTIGKVLETNLNKGIKKVLCLIYPN